MTADAQKKYQEKVARAEKAIALQNRIAFR